MSFAPDAQSDAIAPDETPIATTPAAGRSLARNASVLALGNVASRALGLVREMVLATVFGPSGALSAFRIAAQIPNLIYDMLVGGMLSAALVPVLSAKSHEERRELFATLLSVFGIILAGLSLLLFVAAPALASLLAVGFKDDPLLFPLTIQLIRWMAPAVWFLSIAGLLTAGLFASQRFTVPAAGSAIFNLGVVLTIPLLAARLGILAAALGVVLGSVLQASVMAWDVRRAGLPLRPRWNWRNPALLQILRLYLPIALGLMVMLFQVGLDRRLASTTGEESIAWMAFATTLQQLPLGLISVAVSLASLPSLSRYFAAHEESNFVATLGKAMRYVLLLIVPSAIALAVLAEPVTRVIFEHGAFTSEDTTAVVAALEIYLIGMLFAAIDFPLNYAFYARNNTLLPALVGILSVVVYIIVAFALIEGSGYLGLVWADTAKQIAHAIVMVACTWLLIRRTSGNSPVAGTVSIVWRTLAAGAAMTAVLIVTDRWLQSLLPVTFWGDLILIFVAGGLAGIVYVGALRILRVNEVMEVWHRLRPGV